VTLFHSQRTALAAALLLTAAAGVCWHDAYDRRGRRRPLWSKVAGAVM
jgi:hypothetical protein